MNVPAMPRAAGWMVELLEVAVTAPLRTMALAESPRPASDETTRVPPVTVTFPVKVFVPLRTRRPVPLFVSEPVPPMAPPTVRIPASPV